VGSVQQLFGIPIHALTTEQVLNCVDEAIRQRGRLLLGVVNAAKIVNMHRDEILGRSVLTADMILADGMAVVWAGRVLRRRLPERVAGIDLMESILARGARQGYRVFCLGATQEILDETVARMQQRYPGIVVAGRHHGYFQPEDEPRLVEQIRASRADVLFAAMSSPKKEQFLARWADDMGVPVLHGVGGAFDVMAGKVKRAPILWQRLGLEWLYRVVQEPRRMWRRYLVTNALFCWLLAREFFRPSASVGGLQGAGRREAGMLPGNGKRDLSCVCGPRGQNAR
jgi:N-acetylglucosaminyldiphosphoundecaprenol N-acetyl-beta-D-mannosaminyltransferase